LYLEEDMKLENINKLPYK